MDLTIHVHISSKMKNEIDPFWYVDVLFIFVRYFLFIILRCSVTFPVSMYAILYYLFCARDGRSDGRSGGGLTGGRSINRT